MEIIARTFFTFFGKNIKNDENTGVSAA